MPRGIQLWRQSCRLHLPKQRHGCHYGFVISIYSTSLMVRLAPGMLSLLKLQLHSSVRGASQCRETENLRVMFIRQIVDPAEDRQMWVYFVFRRNVDEVVIFDVEIRAAEIQFFARVYKLCFCCGAQSFAPKVRRRNVDFVARPPRQARAL